MAPRFENHGPEAGFCAVDILNKMCLALAELFMVLDKPARVARAG
jgi:hypothetical protein